MGEGPKTNRQLFEQKLELDVTCVGCHRFFDPVGYAFEHYDAVGAFRSNDNGLPIDAAGTVMTGTDIDGSIRDALDLSQKLGQSADVQACVSRRWMEHGLGRRLDDGELCKVLGLKEALVAANGNVREMLVALATSRDFTRIGVQEL